MKKILIENAKVIVLALFCSLGIGIAYAWTAPSTTPPGGNVSAPINASSLTQIKQGNLDIVGLNALGQAYTNGLIVENGNVGIGTLTPTRKVEIAGDLKVNGSVEYKTQLAKPFVYYKSQTVITATETNILNVAPITTGNVLTPTKLTFILGGTSGSYNSGAYGSGRLVITYSDGTSITSQLNVKSTASESLSLDIPSYDGYHGSVSKIDFYITGINNNNPPSWPLTGTAYVSGYETKL
jgi:hypothetical protein